MFIENCDIRHETKAHLMEVHHSGKDESRGARGSSALKAAIDTQIHISQSNDVISAQLEKQSDGTTGLPKK